MSYNIIFNVWHLEYLHWLNEENHEKVFSKHKAKAAMPMSGEMVSMTSQDLQQQENVMTASV